MVQPQPLPADRLAAIRTSFPVLDRVCYLNTGTYGPMPDPALQSLLHATAQLERDGVAAEYPFSDDAETVRGMLAEMIGGQPEGIAFTRNATDGINLVLSGLEWDEGDVILTSDEEHEAILHPLLYLQASRGVVIRRVSCSPDEAGMLRRLDSQWSHRVRLVAISHVTCETGTLLPVAAICRWAAERQTYSLVDIAQSLGAVPVHAPSIGCDFLAGNGHKWLHGPKGTGFLYATPDRLVRLVPRHVGAGSLQHASFDTAEAVPWPTGQRFEYGTRSWALAAGWKESILWLKNIGQDAVYRHIAAMAHKLRSALQMVAPVTVLTPDDGHAGLVSFSVAGWDAGDLCARLRTDFNIVVRHVPRWNAVRVSAAHFTSNHDVARLQTAMDVVTREWR